MKGVRGIPKILKINGVKGLLVSMLFSTGESRIVDFDTFFDSDNSIKKGHPAYKLLRNEKEFNQLEVLGNTVGWKNAGVWSIDFEGKKVFYHYDLDPLVLYNASLPDPKRSLKIGDMLKRARRRAGLTQEQLALRIGTTKHYISRIENEKSDIELLTLKKIVEAGLGKQLNIQIR